ncbi:MAG: hypothetical protein WC520_03420 [Candidatus Paceibacterota bacterium]
MIAQSINFVVPLLTAAVIFIATVVVGIYGQKKLNEGKPAKAHLTLAVLGICLLLILIVSTYRVDGNTLGIDKDGNWYEPGLYFIIPFTKQIEILQLSGSFPVSENAAVSYRLSPAEAEKLGKNFPEIIKNQTVVQETFSDTVMVTEFVNYPKGVNFSQFTLTTSFTPSFYFIDSGFGRFWPMLISTRFSHIFRC